MACILASKNSLDIDLLNEYISICIHDENHSFNLQENCFDPWKVCGDFQVLYRVASSVKSILQDYEHEFDAIICLSDSGIPLSCVLSKIAEKDLFFFKEKGIKIEDLDREVLLYPRPNPEKHRNILVVDSNINTGRTLCSCVSHLNDEYKFDKIAAFSPIILDERVVDKQEIKDVLVFSLASTDITHEVTSSLIGKTEKEDLINFFANHPSEPMSDEISFLQEKSNIRINKFIRGIIRFRASFYKDIELPLLDNDLSDYLNQFGSKESEIWKLISQAEVMNLICETIFNNEDINNYSYLIGTGVLGTFFAFELAASAQFKGKVLSMEKKGGWIQKVSPSVKEEGLVCMGRIRTGYFLREANKLMKKYGIQAKLGIAIRQTKEGAAVKYSKSLNTILSVLPDLTVLSRDKS